MRIRSIKPEFWRSDDITVLDWFDRLIFIGLWSYVDDNGVGLDKLASVAADLFAGDIERDPRDTFARVSRGLQNLSEAGRITRYTVDGRAFLAISNWDRHQRIDKPNKPRYPLPTCGNAEIRESVATSSRESRESPAPGTGEQGNRGTGEQGIPPTAGVVASDAPATAQTLIAEWIDHCGARPPSRVIGQVSKEVGAMLTEGIGYDDVRVGLAVWHGKGLHPSTLASVVHEHRTRDQRGATRKESTTDARVRDGLALAERFSEMDAEDALLALPQGETA